MQLRRHHTILAHVSQVRINVGEIPKIRESNAIRNKVLPLVVKLIRDPSRFHIEYQFHIQIFDPGAFSPVNAKGISMTCPVLGFVNDAGYMPDGL